LDKDIADFALNYASSKKVEYAEVRAHNDKGEGLVIRNGALDAYSSAVDSGFCVRILAEGGIGFASTNKWTKDEAKTVVDIAYKTAKAAKRKDGIRFAKEKSVKASWNVPEKKKIDDLTAEARIETMTELDKALVSQKINIAARVFGFGTTITEKYFLNTEGSIISSRIPRIGAYGFITVVENGKPEQASKSFGHSGGWEALDQWKLAEQMTHEAKVLQKVIKEG
jgi:TldD protein